MPSTAAVMTDGQFQELRKIIYERSGIHFADGKKYVLESRLCHRLTELDLENFEQYVQLLSTGPFQQDEFQEMFNRITINETSFFRNEPQLEVFEREVLSDLLEARKNTKRLRLWSAACSTGEEPYTLAIILARTLGVRLMDWRIEILGTDISERVLDIAAAGRYGEYALRSTPAPVRQRYFRQDGNEWVLSETVREMVTFTVHNLKDRAGARRFGTFDVIFCRNVMIYFDEAMRAQVVKTFYDQLAEDGTLFIGHSETLRGEKAAFVPMPQPQAFAYKRSA